VNKSCAVLLAVLVAWSMAGCGSPAEKTEQSKEAQTVKVEKGSLRLAVATTGRVVANLEIEIKCKASGEVAELPFEVSDSVGKGDLLVRLNPIDEERSVKRAEASLSISRARVAQAKFGLEIAERDLATERTRAEAALRSAQARATEAKGKFERSRALVKQDTVSLEAFESDQAAYIQAEATLSEANARMEDLKSKQRALESKRHDIAIAEAQVAGDEINLSDAQQRLIDTKVLAPMSGVVVARNVQVGQIISSGISNVGGGTAVMVLADLSRLFVVASVDESDIGKIQKGQQTVITVDAYPERKFYGQVLRIATKGENVSNVVTFEVTIEVGQRNRELLKPEMTANIEIIAAERENALMLPVKAVRRRRRDRYVLVVEPGKPQPVERPVEVGISDGENMEIVKGVTEGEVISTGGSDDSKWRSGGGDRSGRQRERMQIRMMGGGPRRR